MRFSINSLVRSISSWIATKLSIRTRLLSRATARRSLCLYLSRRARMRALRSLSLRRRSLMSLMPPSRLFDMFRVPERVLENMVPDSDPAGKGRRRRGGGGLIGGGAGCRRRANPDRKRRPSASCL